MSTFDGMNDVHFPASFRRPSGDRAVKKMTMRRVPIGQPRVWRRWTFTHSHSRKYDRVMVADPTGAWNMPGQLSGDSAHVSAFGSPIHFRIRLGHS
jgi:hypothetical protein